MKLRLFALAIICLLSTVAFAQEEATSTATPSATPRGSYVIRPDIYVRGGPGETYAPVGRLVAGDVVQPLSRNEAATWVLIAYGRGFGWIRRDLAYWAENISGLPVVDETNLTPSPIPGIVTATPFFFTPTPSGNWINVGPQGAYVRAGPGTRYPALGELREGTLVESVGRDADGEWILIRFNDGFAWISRRLVQWVDNLNALPILRTSALTPSATFTGTLTATDTPTPTDTPTNTLTFTPTDTALPTETATNTLIPTETLIPSDTLTNTPEPSLTDTPEPTDTATNTAAPSATPTLTETPSQQPSNTPEPTETATNTSVPSATPTEVPTNTATYTLEPSPTNTIAPTNTLTSTVMPTQEPTETAALTEAPSNTPDEVATETPTRTAIPPSDTPTLTQTLTPTDTVTISSVTPSETPVEVAAVISLTGDFAVTATRIALETAVAVGQATVDALQTATAMVTLTPMPLPTTTPSITPTSTRLASATPASDMIGVAVPTEAAQTSEPQAPSTPSTGRLPIELIVGGVALLLVLVYVGLYWRGLSTAERYADGFIIEQCPVCGRGHLMVETRHDRVFGIPRARTTIRCSVCRSVLRETGNRRWRYAVDRIENPVLYDRFNGRVVDEATLKSLADHPQAPASPHPRPPSKPPTFEDEA